MYLLGYDIGSSSIKAALVDVESNKVVNVAQHPDVEMDIVAHKPGWAEQDPEIWWNNIIEATRKLMSQSPGIDPAAIGE